MISKKFYERIIPFFQRFLKFKDSPAPQKLYHLAKGHLMIYDPIIKIWEIPQRSPSRIIHSYPKYSELTEI